MQRKSSKHTGDKTKPAQQRINRKLSVSTLLHLLELNFSTGCHVITLGYESAEYAPAGEYAEADIRAWVKCARAQLGGKFQYVRATEHGRDGDYAAVHRIVTAYPERTARALAEIWTYGPIRVDAIGAGELPALAGYLTANAAVPNRRSWIASRGLKRS